MPVFNTQGLPVQLVIQPDRNFADLASQIRPDQVLKGRVVELLKGGRAIVNFRGIAVTAALKGVVLVKGEVISVVVKDAEGTPVFRLVDEGQLAAELQRSPAPAGIDPGVAAILERLGLPRDGFHAAIVSLVRDYGGNPSRETLTAIRELVFSFPSMFGAQEAAMAGSQPGWDAAGAGRAGGGALLPAPEGPTSGKPWPAAFVPRGIEVDAGASPARPGLLSLVTGAEAGEAAPASPAGEDQVAAGLLSRGYTLGRLTAAIGDIGSGRPVEVAAAQVRPAPAPIAGAAPGIEAMRRQSGEAGPGLTDLLFAGIARPGSVNPADLLFRIADWLPPGPQGGEDLSRDVARLALSLGREYHALESGTGAAARTADFLGEAAGVTVRAAAARESAAGPAVMLALEAAGFIAGVLHETAARVFEGQTGLDRSTVVVPALIDVRAVANGGVAPAVNEAVSGAPQISVARLMELVSEAARSRSPDIASSSGRSPGPQVPVQDLGMILLSGKAIQSPPATGGNMRENIPGAEVQGPSQSRFSVSGGSRDAAPAGIRAGAQIPVVPSSSARMGEPAAPIAGGPVLPTVLSAEGVSPRFLETAVFMQLTGLPPVRAAARAAHEYLFGEIRIQEVLRRFEDVARAPGALPPEVRSVVDKAETAARSLEVSLDKGKLPEALRSAVERIGLDHESVLARAAAELRDMSRTEETIRKLAGVRDTLKSAFLELRETIGRFKPPVSAAGLGGVDRLSTLDSAAREVLDLVQSQQIGSFVRSDATHTVYVQVPILFGSELRGGELHVSWRRDRSGRKRDQRTPAMMSVSLDTRALGLVRAQVTMTGQVLSVKFRLQSREAADFVSAEMPGLLSRLEGMKYLVQGMSCGVEEGSTEPESGVLRPASALDLKA